MRRPQVVLAAGGLSLLFVAGALLLAARPIEPPAAALEKTSIRAHPRTSTVFYQDVDNDNPFPRVQAFAKPVPPAAALKKASKWTYPRTSTVFDPDDDIEYPSYRVPAIAKLSGTTLLAFAEARPSKREDGPSDIIVKRSDDDGITWSLDAVSVVSNQFGILGLPPDTRGYTTYGNPTPITLEPQAGDAQGEAEVLLLFTVNETWVYLTRTSDGEEWSNALNISDQAKMPGWGRIATGPGHGLRLRHGPHAGRLLAPFNHMLAQSSVVQTQLWVSDARDARLVSSVQTDYELDNPMAAPQQQPHGRGSHSTLHHFSQREHASGRIVEYGVGQGMGGLNAYEARGSFGGSLYSDDNGLTWHAGSDIPALGSHEHMMAELPSGEVVSSYRAHGGRGPSCRHFASSTDGGITWALREQAVVAGTDGPGCTVPDAQCEGSLASTGRWLYAAGPNDPDTRRELGLYASDDGGLTWSLIGRPNGVAVAGYSDLVTWPPVGVEPWPQIGILYEHGPPTASAISFTRAQLGDE